MIDLPEIVLFILSICLVSQAGLTWFIVAGRNGFKSFPIHAATSLTGLWVVTLSKDLRWRSPIRFWFNQIGRLVALWLIYEAFEAHWNAVGFVLIVMLLLDLANFMMAHVYESRIIEIGRFSVKEMRWITKKERENTRSI